MVVELASDQVTLTPIAVDSTSLDSHSCGYTCVAAGLETSVNS